MFTKFFDSSQVQLFCCRLASEMARRLPPAQIAGNSKHAPKRHQQIEDWLRRQVDQFTRGTALNVYQKAKLGPILQRALDGEGYPADFSKRISYELVKLVAQAAAMRR